METVSETEKQNVSTTHKAGLAKICLARLQHSCQGRNSQMLQPPGGTLSSKRPTWRENQARRGGRAYSSSAGATWGKQFRKSHFAYDILRIVSLARPDPASNPGAQPALHFRGGNFHEISFNDVIMLIQPWYNFFANGHI